MYRQAEELLNRLVRSGDAGLLRGGLKGLEKESLRINRSGDIAQTPHPRCWGSALTHPFVTTDYSEALPELITPPFATSAEVIEFLRNLHIFLYSCLDQDELLWSASMPCAVGDDQGIPIARYGSSNVGMMKHVYRVGLDYRYGRRMQAIAGVHFNYSLPEEFWPAFQEEMDAAGDLRDFIDDSYFGMIRNFRRLGWLVPFLFGNSPAVCKSFLAGRTTRFKPLDGGTYHLPYATSLRMSDIGYKNKNQSALHVSYDTLTDYVTSLRKAIETPYPEYEAIGIQDHGRWVQLNTNVLQIENEYYSFVRPKRATLSGEKPTKALHDRGVQYVEVRALDVDAFNPIGVEEDQLLFLEAFLIFCLLADSPNISEAEEGCIEYNELTIALRGREPGVELLVGKGKKCRAMWVNEILSGMASVCDVLDDGEERGYRRALNKYAAMAEDTTQLPSARTLAALMETGQPFAKYTMALSEQHERSLRDAKLDPANAAEMQQLAAVSLADQSAIEENDDVSFAEYLDAYFNGRLAKS